MDMGELDVHVGGRFGNLLVAWVAGREEREEEREREGGWSGPGDSTSPWTGLPAPSKVVQPLSGLDHLLSSPLPKWWSQLPNWFNLHPFPKGRRCSPIPIGVHGFPLLFKGFFTDLHKFLESQGKAGEGRGGANGRVPPIYYKRRAGMPFVVLHIMSFRGFVITNIVTWIAPRKSKTLPFPSIRTQYTRWLAGSLACMLAGLTGVEG